MIIVWLLVGIGAVSIAFFIPPNSSELWPAINTAAIPLILYILALAATTLRSPITLKARIIAWVSIVVVGIATYASWMGTDIQSHWQREKLMQIHTVITRGILTATVPDQALNVLDAYHKQGSKKKETLAQAFQRMNDGAGIGANIYKPRDPWDTTLAVVVRSISDNEVVLLGTHSYSKGRDKDFRNFNGRTGLIQEKYTLTEKGVSYESEN